MFVEIPQLVYEFNLNQNHNNHLNKKWTKILLSFDKKQPFQLLDEYLPIIPEMDFYSITVRTNPSLIELVESNIPILSKLQIKYEDYFLCGVNGRIEMNEIIPSMAQIVLIPTDFIETNRIQINKNEQILFNISNTMWDKDGNYSFLH